MSGSKPIKMWIQGKTFPIQKFSEMTKKLNKPKTDHEHDDESQIIPHEEYIKLLDITEDKGNFTTQIQVPKLYKAKLFTLPKFDIEKISKVTNATIIIPGYGKESDITLSSQNTIDLVKAVAHIHSAIGEVRSRTLPFQFTCIPCSTPSIREKFESLKQQILYMKEEVDGFHESIFISPLKLHITIDVFSLLDDDEKLEAIRVLNEYKSTLEKLGPLKLNIASLSCMNDNIEKTDVIYANVRLLNETNDNNLQTIIDALSHHFYEKGLLKKYQENVKLHMTIINTKYRKDKTSPKRKRRRLSIDATKIFEKFKDFEFGDCDFDSLHLSHMTLKGDDGFYKPLAVIKLGDQCV
ncbi:unnamed protein product [Ceutorhynchus assimilis]|uniref:A-kinase anchor protein 7-like phosphoesterase domain-containing protein n=1 Tax=Ceutorhynchus assimilis TaxID=467358 RepID=A0A9P0DFI8_9CUCU|nr:unnamed protein product [Ceutorhynchus assimilis]